MEGKHLYTIDPPNKNRPPEMVAKEIIQLIRHKFKYNTAMLCKLLHCDRQWVDKYIRNEVDHIFVTYFFRQHIAASFPDLFQDDEMDTLLHGFYFYSEESLKTYWETHAVAERKTVVVDLADYRCPGVSVTDLRNEYLFHQAAKPCQKEKERHLEKIERLVNGTGLDIYQRSRVKKEWVSCKLPPLYSNLKLTTAAEFRRRNGLHSNTSAMEHLFRRGAVRIKLGSRALWVVPEDKSVFPVAIQAT